MGRNKIKERSVAISLNSVRRQGSMIRAQGLTDDPALHTRMKTVVCEDLRRQKQVYVIILGAICCTCMSLYMTRFEHVYVAPTCCLRAPMVE